MIPARDFSQRKTFPGTTGNPFDRVLHAGNALQKIPTPIFALILAGVGFLPAGSNFRITAPLWAAFILDWLLLAALPRFRRSFGPPQPPVLFLAVLRAIVAALTASLPGVNLALQILGVVLVVYGFWIEPHALRLTHQTLRSPRLPKGTSVRLLHLADLHVERITGREESLNRHIRELKPDLILFSGDILNLSYLNDPQAWADARCVLSDWRAPMGVFAVSGSPAVDLPDIFPQLIEGLPVQRLDNAIIQLPIPGGSLEVLGLTCSHNPSIDAPLLEELLVDRDPDTFRVLLYHSPDLAPNAAHHPIDLMLSGHTHGGQVRLPGIGALITGSLYGKRLEVGKTIMNRLVLYISRGIGMEGAFAPRVRFLCPPEIILWDLQGE